MAEIISQHLGREIKRNLEQSRGDITADVFFEHDGVTHHLEVKRRERLSKPSWLKQAEAHRDKFGEGCAIVVYRQNREPWNVYYKVSGDIPIEMPLTHWLKYVIRTPFAD